MRKLFPILSRPAAIAVAAISIVSAQPASTSADVETLLERAYDLDAGTNGPRDSREAAALYQQAADAGDPFAQLRLGYLAETGDGVLQDYRKARLLYEQAAISGLAAARLRLAICHLEGWGGAQDKEAFAREVRAAAEAGEVPAQRILSTMYFIGFGVPEDREEAVKWLERAAALDDAQAQYALGRDAEQRRRHALMPDLSLPRTWYQLSAEQEYQTAMRALARTFLTGARSDRNWELGKRWLRLATDSGDSEAPYILAVSELLHVDAPSRSEEHAREWLKLASERGNPRASEVIELELGSGALAGAMQYVLNTPYDDRYVERAEAKAGDAPTRPPVVMRIVRPIYPQALHLTEAEGRVLVDFHVDTSGRVNDPKVVETSHPLFAERALEAVRQWRFHPGRRNGRLVKTHMQVPVMFEIRRESLNGTDGVLAFAYRRARDLGGNVLADATALRLAMPKRRLPRPGGASAQSAGRAMILLALDPEGRPQRAHVLSAEPAEIGPALVAVAMRNEFVARTENGERVSSNVVLTYRTGRYHNPVLRAK